MTAFSQRTGLSGKKQRVCCWLLLLHVGKWLDPSASVTSFFVGTWLGSASFSQTRETHGSVLPQKRVAGCFIQNCCFDVLGLYGAQKEGARTYHGDFSITATQPRNKSLCFSNEETGILPFRALNQLPPSYIMFYI